MKPDLDAIRARCEAAQVIFERSSVVAPCVYDDIPALLAYIEQLQDECDATRRALIDFINGRDEDSERLRAAGLDFRTFRKLLMDWYGTDNRKDITTSKLWSMVKLMANELAKQERASWAEEHPPEYSQEHDCWLCERCGRGVIGTPDKPLDGWKKRPTYVTRPSGHHRTECDKCCTLYRNAHDDE